MVSLLVEVLQDHFFMNWVRKFSCFVAGTQVVVGVVRDADSASGVRYVTKSIEELRIGDVVYARDEFGTAVGAQRVTETYRGSVEQLRVLTFSAGSGGTQTLRATTAHPFWVVNRNEFVPARLLEPGDVVLGPTGERQTLVSNAEEFHPHGVLVYNLTVSDWHTYFVSQTSDDTPIWAHNRCDIKTFRENDSPTGRIMKVKAEAKTTDLYSGTSTNQKARTYARSQGDAQDDAGHLIAKLLGGEADLDNIVGMNRKLNRGKYRDFEMEIAEKLEDLGENGSAKITIELKYDGASMRPSKLVYKVEYFVNGLPDGSPPRIKPFDNNPN